MVGKAGLHKRQDEVYPEHLPQQVRGVDKAIIARLSNDFEVASCSHLQCSSVKY